MARHAPINICLEHLNTNQSEKTFLKGTEKTQTQKYSCVHPEMEKPSFKLISKSVADITAGFPKEAPQSCTSFNSHSEADMWAVKRAGLTSEGHPSAVASDILWSLSIYHSNQSEECFGKGRRWCLSNQLSVTFCFCFFLTMIAGRRLSSVFGTWLMRCNCSCFVLFCFVMLATSSLLFAKDN